MTLFMHGGGHSGQGFQGAEHINVPRPSAHHQLVVAVRLFALVTGATGRCLPHIPFGISTAWERQVQPPIDPGTQAV